MSVTAKSLSHQSYPTSQQAKTKSSSPPFPFPLSPSFPSNSNSNLAVAASLFLCRRRRRRPRSSHINSGSLVFILFLSCFLLYVFLFVSPFLLSSSTSYPSSFTRLLTTLDRSISTLILSSRFISPQIRRRIFARTCSNFSWQFILCSVQTERDCFLCLLVNQHTWPVLYLPRLWGRKYRFFAGNFKGLGWEAFISWCKKKKQANKVVLCYKREKRSLVFTLPRVYVSPPFLFCIESCPWAHTLAKITGRGVDCSICSLSGISHTFFLHFFPLFRSHLIPSPPCFARTWLLAPNASLFLFVTFFCPFLGSWSTVWLVQTLYLVALQVKRIVSEKQSKSP